MTNGTAALQLLVSEPASSTYPEVDKLDAVFTASQEIEIGDLIARAAVLMCQAAEKYLAGRATYPTSMQTGELIAQLYFLQQQSPEVFATTVIREGRRAVMAAMAQGAAVVASNGDMDQAVDEVLSWPLDVLARVTESEKAFAN
jgi:hypothetical protein